MTEPNTEANAARVRSLVAAVLAGPANHRASALVALLDLVAAKREPEQTTQLLDAAAAESYNHSAQRASSFQNWRRKAGAKIGG